MPRKDRNRLTGELLIKHIKYVSGSSNLLNYEGNIRTIAADCGYLNLYNIGGKGSKGGLFRFFRAYYDALKDLNLYQDDLHSNYEDLKKELHKKYEPIPEKKKTKNRELDAGEIINNLNRWKLREEEFDENAPENAADKALRLGLDVVGVALLERVLELHKEGETELMICIRTGYDVQNIGRFRRAFAKAAKVEFAPLSRMLKEFEERELISKTPVVNIENNNETEKFIETEESEELFIDREKITSQVKRTYRNPKFRKKVLAIHGSVCCCCDIAIETLIEAAHIVPVENKGNDDASNGIPLCPTHHTAFDNFLFTINPTDNLIIYKGGLSSEDLQITKTKCDINVSKESLDYRLKLFNE